VLQHAFLKLVGLVGPRRGSGFSQFNTVLELDEDTHRRITELQRKAGLHKKENLGSMSAMELIEVNLDVLQQAGLSKEQVDAVWDDVSELLPSLGDSAFNAGETPA